MNNSILLGKAIYSILSGDTQIKNYVSNKIFPIVAENNTIAPFIVYDINNITANYTKDGNLNDNVTLSINIIASNYYDAVTIANLIRAKIELIYGIYNDVNILQSLQTSFNVVWGIDGYVATLQFAMICK